MAGAAVAELSADFSCLFDTRGRQRRKVAGRTPPAFFIQLSAIGFTMTDKENSRHGHSSPEKRSQAD